MITWFQRVFGKHFKWVLLAFLVVLLISFIVGIGAVPSLSLQGSQGKSQMLLGVDLNNAQEIQNLSNAVQFTYRNLYKIQISSQQELQTYVLQRIALMHLADEWHVPEPTAQDLENYLKSARAFLGPDGRFSPEIYQAFRDGVDSSAQRDAVATLLKDDCRLDRVRGILAGPGYTLPYLAQTQIALTKVKSDLDVATLDYKSFTPKVTLTGDKLEAVLKQIFDKDPTKFPQPAQADLNYVKFAAATVADPTPAQLKDYATQHKADFPGINPDSLSDKDKTAVTAAWSAEQKNTALTDAKNVTMKFARELYDLKAPAGSPAFKALLGKYKVTLQTLPTVVEGKPAPANSPIPDDILQEAASSLNAQQTFAPVPLDDGAAVLFLVKGTPARSSTFAEAHEDVLKVYTESEKQRQFIERCTAVHDAVVKDMASGKTFVEAAKAEGLIVNNYPDVTYDDIQNTLMTMPFDETDKSTTPTGPLAPMGKDVLTVLANSNNNSAPLLTTLRTGEPSAMQMDGNTGVMFYTVKRETANVSADSPEVVQAQLTLKDYENEFATNIILGQIVQAAQQALKPAGS